MMSYKNQLIEALGDYEGSDFVVTEELMDFIRDFKPETEPAEVTALRNLSDFVTFNFEGIPAPLVAAKITLKEYDDEKNDN